MCLLALHVRMLFEVIWFGVSNLSSVSCVFKNFHWLRCLGLHFPISSYRRFMWSLFYCFYSWTFVSRILWSEGLCGTGLWSVGSPTDGRNCCVCLHCQPCAAVWAPSPDFPSVLLHIAAPLVLGLLRGPWGPALGIGFSIWFPACLCSSLLPGRVLGSLPPSVSVDGTDVAAHWDGCPSPMSQVFWGLWSLSWKG